MYLGDKLKAFKQVTRDYQKYIDHINGIDDKLELLKTKMENVHSINFEKEITASSYEERPIVEMIERKELLEKEKKHYLDLIAWIFDVINSFESPAIKVLIWMTYVQRKSLASIADKYLIGKDNLYKIRRKYLIKALTDEIMVRLDEIQNETITKNEN